MLTRWWTYPDWRLRFSFRHGKNLLSYSLSISWLRSSRWDCDIRVLNQKTRKSLTRGFYESWLMNQVGKTHLNKIDFYFFLLFFFSKKLQMRGDKEGELLFLPMRAFFRTIVPVMNENIFFSAEKRISLILSEWRVAVYQLDGWSNSLLLIGHS